MEAVKTKTTPGPWYATGNGIHIRKGTVGLCVGVGHDPHEPGHCTDVALANTALMAAAPNLLAVCDDILAILTHPTRHVTIVEQVALEKAIAKARGDS
jgi:hypothetical protein